MEIIALRGSSTCGKTGTLIMVYNQLLANGGISTNKQKLGGNPRDFSDIVNYKGKTIAFYTMGDYSYCTTDAIKDYDQQNVDILICASNVRFTKPIQLIQTYTHHLVIKTIASPLSPENIEAANTADRNTIISYI